MQLEPQLAKSVQSITARRGRKGVPLQLIQLDRILERSRCLVHAARQLGHLREVGNRVRVRDQEVA